MRTLIIICFYSCVTIGMDKPTTLDQKFAETVLSGKIEQVRAYLDQGANPGFDSKLICKLMEKLFAKPIITPADKKLKDDLLELLIYDPRTQLNCYNDDGLTPLMILVRQNEVDLATLMLASERAEIDAENNQGITAFDMVKSTGMRRLLMDVGARSGSGRVKKTPKPSPVKALSSPRKSPKVASSPAKSPLKWKDPILVPQFKSAQQEFFDVIRRSDMHRLFDMVKGGFPSYINDIDPFTHQTPISLAVQNNSSPVVAKLLEAPRLDLKLKNISGNTPLMLAVIQDNFDIVYLLVKDGRSPINEINRFGSTALDFVEPKKQNGNRIQQLLRENGAKTAQELKSK